MKSLLQIAWPAWLELCVIIAVGMLGTLWAAHLSDQAGAAFSLASQLTTLLALGYKMVSVGMSVVVAQKVGQGRKDIADGLARAAMGAGSWIGMALCALLMFTGPWLLTAMGSPPELLPLALPYLHMVAPALLLEAWNSIMIGVLRAQLRVGDLLLVMILTQATHLLLALALMPALGMLGFALALVVSRLLAFVAYLSLWQWRLGLVLVAADWWRWRMTQIRWIARIGLPGAAAEILYRLAFAASFAASARLGSDALAAQAYSLQINIAVLLVGLATSIGVEIVISRLMGASHFKQAHQLLMKAVSVTLPLSVALAATAAICGKELLVQFTSNLQIVDMGITLLWLTLLLEPGRTLNLLMNAALRAAGDATYPVLAGVGSLIFVLAGGSWLLAIHWHMGLMGIWLAFAADEWLRGWLMWRRWQTLGWLANARLSRRRAAILSL